MRKVSKLGEEVWIVQKYKRIKHLAVLPITRLRTINVAKRTTQMSHHKFCGITGTIKILGGKVDKIQRLVAEVWRDTTPQNFPNKINFMSMFNDIEWNRADNSCTPS